MITGQYLADKLRAAARQRGVPLHRFLAPLSRNPTSFIDKLAEAQEPRAHTIARIDALIAGEPLPELHRKIVISVPHSVWCALEAEARRTRRKMADVAAEMLQFFADESE